MLLNGESHGDVNYVRFRRRGHPSFECTQSIATAAHENARRVFYFSAGLDGASLRDGGIERHDVNCSGRRKSRLPAVVILDRDDLPRVGTFAGDLKSDYFRGTF